jgi:predicted nucleic acid-binding protein
MVVRGDLEAEGAAVARDLLLSMPVRLAAPVSLFTRAWDLAVELNRPQAYDSFYLATAELLGSDLWTADERFFSAASGRYASLRLLRNFIARGVRGSRR